MKKKLKGLSSVFISENTSLGFKTQRERNLWVLYANQSSSGLFRLKPSYTYLEAPDIKRAVPDSSGSVPISRLAATWKAPGQDSGVREAWVGILDAPNPHPGSLHRSWVSSCRSNSPLKASAPPELNPLLRRLG